MFYITGDTHGKFERIADFCETSNTCREDVLIILGDAGINYYGGKKDIRLKEKLAALPITLFCLHGNHEARPASTGLYELCSWHGGQTYRETAYPNLLFAEDGEIYELGGYRCFAIGGAYSVDKYYRLEKGFKWFLDEQPDDEAKQTVEARLENINWKVDVVLTHTCPLKYEPTEVFLPFIDQSGVDKSTEEWLDRIESRLTYQKWYCGHYHTEKQVDKLEFLFESIQVFCQ